MDITFNKSHQTIQFSLNKGHKNYHHIYMNLFILLSQYYGKVHHIWMHDCLCFIENPIGFLLLFQKKEDSFLYCIDNSFVLTKNRQPKSEKNSFDLMIGSIYEIRNAFIYCLEQFVDQNELNCINIKIERYYLNENVDDDDF